MPKPIRNNGHLRVDGTKKGPGFLGTLKRPDGKVSTELSIEVSIDGEEMLIPSLVPTLTPGEIDLLLSGSRPTNEIINKAVEHAEGRKEGGLGFFRESPKYNTREPSDSEDKFFKNNIGVAGRADFESNTIVLNPYTKLNYEQQRAVMKNEASRLAIRENKLIPSFSITDEQTKQFENYGDENSIRETIVGRIVSGDPSALNITPEQEEFAEKIKKLIGEY